MSYQVLARKWRPANFHEMQGQQHVLQALINGLDSDRLHHAYLFTGTRGVGKTSIARILAKCLNCERGVSSKPCGECSACAEIAENRFVDLIEVDAASRTKVEDTRELLENVQYAPTVGRFKIYLIDEVHMLSTHSFNALLKTLEEPPAHVKFLLATTDPQRLPATVLSRCLQFSLKNIGPDLIVDHLQKVLGAEGVTAEEAALWHIARAAAGSMRDALSLTDQAIAFGGTGIIEADVRAMLGSIDRDSICELIRCLVARDARAALDLVEQAASNGVDLENMLAELQNALHGIAIFQAVPEYKARELERAAELKQFAAQLAAEDVQLFYQISLNAQRDLPFAPEPKLAIEMAVMRMLAFLPAGQAVDVSNNPAAGPAGPAITPATPPSTTPSTTPSVLPSTPVPPTSAQPIPGGVQGSGQVSAPVASESALQARQHSAPTVEKKKTDLSHVAGLDWLAVFPDLNLSGMARNVAANCELTSFSQNEVVFCLDEVNCKLFQQAHVRQIEGALQASLGAPVKVSLHSGVVSSETPYLKAQREKRERQQAAIDSIMSDETINDLLQTFGGQVDQSSIRPLD